MRRIATTPAWAVSDGHASTETVIDSGSWYTKHSDPHTTIKPGDGGSNGVSAAFYPDGGACDGGTTH